MTEDVGWLAGLLRQFTRNGGAEPQFAGQPSGADLRQPPVMHCTNYLSYPHSALKPMVTQDVSPADVGEMSDLYTRAGKAMAKFQDDVAAAISDSQTQWQGAAGDAARAFMADTGDWVGRVGQSAQHAGSQLALHSAALAEAKNSMPDERPFDYDAAMADLRTTTDPLAFAAKAGNYLDDYRESQAAHQEAARVVGAYDGRLGAASTMPAFTDPPTMSGSGGDAGTGGGGVRNPQLGDVSGTGPTLVGGMGTAPAMPRPRTAAPLPAGVDGEPSGVDEPEQPSYLIDADADDVFGGTQATAPPVIGG